MNQFCEMKGIKREFSVARTPQQNGVAERKNMTLIEAARTMLADSKFLTTFWAEVVVVNMLVNQSKEFNSRTRIVEENLHVKFSEETPNIAGNRPNWLFDMDALTISMNYKPIVAGNQTNGNAGTKENIDAGQAGKKIVLDQDMPNLEEIFYSDDNEEVCVKDDMNNLATTVPVSPIPTTRVHKDHPLEQIIRDIHSAPQTRRMTKEVTETYHRTCRNELLQFNLQRFGPLVDLPYGNKAIGTKWVYTNKKDDRACARFQVTLKTLHLHAMKRIFRYLKGHPKLGLWYPRDSPFDLEAFSDSDYDGASLDMKSTTAGCQFLRRRLISWQCKKQTIIANSTTEAEYVAAANCYGQNGRAATTASSLEAEQDNGNINRTQSMATLNESFPQGTDSSSGPRCQDTILGVHKLKFDLRLHLNKSYDPPLSRVNTLESREDIMKLKELTEFCTKQSVKALDV
ncbi:putative ribonuclease H-like domain-containing protein [Tanacetum coccineum]